MAKFARIAAILLLLALSLAANKVSMPVPAVVMLGGGELVQVEAEMLPGNGSVYIATQPLIGIQTQESAKTAFVVAGNLSGVDTSRYDMLVRLKDYGNTHSVDGPSGGTAMTLLMLSLMENRTIRSDLTATGTISEDGSVGEVGEVGKKTRAAADGGLSVILIPKSYDTFDKMMLSILGKRWNITIIEVNKISDAAKLAFSPAGTTLQSNVMEVAPSQRVNLTATTLNCSDCHLAEFRALGESIINGDRALLDDIRGMNRSEFSYFVNMLNIDIEEAQHAEDSGYIYSGANAAFLASINLNFLKDSNITYDGLASRMSYVESCISNSKKPNVTKENIEWVAGGEERLAWARKKLAEVEIQNVSEDDDETTLFLFNEVLNAEIWCKVSNEMFSIADNISGTPVDEGKLKGLASSKMSEADSDLKSFAGVDFGDAEWRFEATKDEYDDGSFAAAVYDSEYLVSTVNAVNDSEEASRIFENDLNASASWNSMWAALYANQAQYVYIKANRTLGAASLLLGVYADSLDRDKLEVNKLLESSSIVNNETAQATTEEVGNASMYMGSLSILLVFCVIIAIFLNLAQLFRTEK